MCDREFVFTGGLQDRSDDVEILEGNAAPPPKFFFSYSAPIITDLNPANGPTTGAFVVTITGRHFGYHWNERMPFDGRVRFNMSLCAPQQVGITHFAILISLYSSSVSLRLHCTASTCRSARRSRRGVE